MLFKVIFAVLVVASGVAGGALAQGRGASDGPAKLPKGFKAAWQDGRLNENRGPRTETGNAQMAGVWTNTLPRKLVAGNAVSTAALSDKMPVKVSTKQIGAGNYYIQLTAIEDLPNIAANFRWLRSVGLPGGVMKSNRSGREIQLVLAGPFSAQVDLERAMTLVRSAGYVGAVIQK